MPNHVTTICTVTGSEADVARFEATHILAVPADDKSVTDEMYRLVYGHDREVDEDDDEAPDPVVAVEVLS